jgi:hypothetical protein
MFLKGQENEGINENHDDFGGFSVYGWYFGCRAGFVHQIGQNYRMGKAGYSKSGAIRPCGNFSRRRTQSWPEG